MKTEEEIRKLFDDFISDMDDMLANISRSFHKHDGIVGWDNTSPSEIDKLQRHLLDYRTIMAVKDTAEVLKNSIFEGEEK